jgi:nicotinate-nucleotide adenylyltransferase
VARRGLFGGTFDPPHLGHVAAARAALAALDLDELVVSVANEPQGKASPRAGAPARLALARAAFRDVAGATVSDVELVRGGPTYTIDTVEALLRDHPGDEIVLVVGADTASELGRWHRADELARLVTVAVVPRPGPTRPVAEAFSATVVPMDPVDLSSTGVRAALRRGEDPAALVPAALVPMLLADRLYAP